MGRSVLFNIARKTDLYYDYKYYKEIGHHEKGVRGKRLSNTAIFLQSDWGVAYYSQFFKKCVFTISDLEKSVADAAPLEPNQPLTPDLLLSKLSGTIADFSRLFNIDTHFIFEDMVRRFARHIPLLIAQAETAERYFKQADAKFVFFTNPCEEMLPIHMALSWNSNIVKICKSHGNTAYDLTVWRNSELRPSDIYFVEFPELAAYFEQTAKATKINALVECDAVLANKQHRKKKPDNILIYVPWLMLPALVLDDYYIPQPLFFRIQMQILSALNSQKDLKIVYKCLPKSQYDYHYPVPEYIAENFPNIRVSYKTLTHELQSAHCCLLDAPSSAMWDAINMRVPCQSLVWSKSRIRPSARKSYENYLTFFDSDLDVGEKVKDILQNNRFHMADDLDYSKFKRKPEELLALFRKAEYL
jgi:hypothetical protein